MGPRTVSAGIAAVVAAALWLGLRGCGGPPAEPDVAGGVDVAGSADETAGRRAAEKPAPPRARAPVVAAAGPQPSNDDAGADADRIGVIVVDASHAPVAGAVVVARSDDEVGPLDRATTAADGTATLAARGAASLHAWSDGTAGHAPVAERGDAPAPAVRIVLGPAVGIAGRVRDGSGRPVAGARVRTGPLAFGSGDARAAGRTPLTTRLGFAIGDVEIVLHALTDAEGRFRFDPLAGETRGVDRPPFPVVAEAEGYLPAVARCVRSEAGDVEIVLRRAVRVTGRVIDPAGAPRRGVLRIDVPEHGAAELCEPAADGRFSAADLPEADGPLVLSVYASGSDTPDGVAVVPWRGIDASVVDLGDVVCGATEPIEGRALWPDGSPAETGRVQLTLPVPSVALGHVRPDADGRFRADAPAGVEVDVQAEAWRAAPAAWALPPIVRVVASAGPVRVRSGGAVTLDLVQHPTVVLRLTRSDGTPATLDDVAGIGLTRDTHRRVEAWDAGERVVVSLGGAAPWTLAIRVAGHRTATVEIAEALPFVERTVVLEAEDRPR